MASSFTDNSEKCIIRTRWDQPLLKFLNTAYGVRFRYCGLPGVDLIDVKLWGDMIDEVIAFEPPSDNIENPRDTIIALRRNMRTHRIRGRAFWGSFEEVVLLRRDYEGTPYSQDHLVTLYNLDFCDEIASAIKTQDGGKKVWRFEAIRRILFDQLECFRREEAPRHFILMLTVRNQIGSEKIRSYLSPTRLQGDARDFYRKCSATNAIPKERGPLIGTHTWALKALLFNSLCGYFGNPNLSALFFPQVTYQGTPICSGHTEPIPSPMLHWIVLCRFSDPEVPGPDYFPVESLWYPSVAVLMNSKLVWSSADAERPAPGYAPDTVEWLTRHGAQIVRGLKRS